MDSNTFVARWGNQTSDPDDIVSSPGGLAPAYAAAGHTALPDDDEALIKEFSTATPHQGPSSLSAEDEDLIKEFSSNKQPQSKGTQVAGAVPSPTTSTGTIPVTAEGSNLSPNTVLGRLAQFHNQDPYYLASAVEGLGPALVTGGIGGLALKGLGAVMRNPNFWAYLTGAGVSGAGGYLWHLLTENDPESAMATRGEQAINTLGGLVEQGARH